MIIVQYLSLVKAALQKMPDTPFSALNYSDPMVARILDAGEQCVQRFGIRRTSMGEVARVGQLSRGSIYRYFSTKDALIAGIMGRQQESFLNRTEAQLEEENSLVEKLTLAVLSGRKDLQEGIFAALAEVEPETLAMMFLNPLYYERSVAFWPPHVRIAQAAGEIGAEVDVAVAADLIVRLAVSLVMFPRMGVALNSRSALQAYLQQVLTGCLGKRAPN